MIFLCVDKHSWVDIVRNIYRAPYIAQVLSILLGRLIHGSVGHHWVFLESLNSFGSVLVLE